jgi:probable DNA repair protein
MAVPPHPSADEHPTPRDFAWGERVAEALAAGTPVLLPTDAAAKALRSAWDARQQAAGLRGWVPATAWSLPTWMSAQWSALVTQGKEARLLLNPAQEHALWTEVCATRTASLSSPDSLAELAAGAWRLAAEYEAFDDLRRFAITDDARTFAAWAANFRARCDRGGLLTQAELATALRVHVENTSWTPPTQLVLLGFNTPYPSAQRLFSALANAGCVIEAPAAAHTAQVSVIAAEDPAHEILTAARWLRTHLEEHPAAHIALVSPALHDEHAALESTLRAQLAPELNDVRVDASAAPFVFATGTPLAEAPVAAAALDLLRWARAPLPLDRVSALLLSPFFFAKAHTAALAEFDAFSLRETPRLRPEISRDAVLRLARKAEFVLLEDWLSRLAQPAQALTQPPLRRTYADWIEAIRTLLDAAQWPGERALQPEHEAALAAWDHALDSIATLDFAGNRVEFADALHALERQTASASLASPQREAAVTVLTPAQAAGACFDALVFLHSDDAHWPQAEHAHPLLGWPLQRERAMPGARDPAPLAVAATTELAASAAKVLFLHAKENDDGELRISPVVDALGNSQHWQRLQAADLLPPAAYAPLIAEDVVADTEPLPPLVSNEVRGGARVLQLQAACAFRAFAEVRLAASAPEPAQLGLDAREGGNFLHVAMDRFWEELHSRDQLEALDAAGREAAVRRAVDAALPAHERNGHWDDAYLALQAERLRSLLMKWINEELRRGPFTVVAKESARKVQVGPLLLSIRRDRVDEVPLASGTTGNVLIDYKTGSAPAEKSWTGERPDEPQLPLYALLPGAENLRAIAFAKIRAAEKDRRWLGYADTDGILPGAAKLEYGSLAEQVEAWRETLTTLATQFAEGDAGVSPKDFPRTCDHCAQRLLCRLDSAVLRAAADAADDDFAGEAPDGL